MDKIEICFRNGTNQLLGQISVIKNRSLFKKQDSNKLKT